MSLLQDEGKKRKLAKREGQSEDELEEGECSSNDSDSSSNDITPELCTSSDSDHEEDQGLFLICFPTTLFDEKKKNILFI